MKITFNYIILGIFILTVFSASITFAGNKDLAKKVLLAQKYEQFLKENLKEDIVDECFSNAGLDIELDNDKKEDINSILSKLAEIKAGMILKRFKVETVIDIFSEQLAFQLEDSDLEEALQSAKFLEKIRDAMSRLHYVSIQAANTSFNQVRLLPLIYGSPQFQTLVENYLKQSHSDIFNNSLQGFHKFIQDLSKDSMIHLGDQSKLDELFLNNFRALLIGQFKIRFSKKELKELFEMGQKRWYQRYMRVHKEIYKILEITDGAKYLKSDSELDSKTIEELKLLEQHRDELYKRIDDMKNKMEEKNKIENNSI